MSITIIHNYVYADEFFNPLFLSDDPKAVADLSRFEKDEGQAPGTYRVEIYLNDEYVLTQDIIFNAIKNNHASKTTDQVTAKKDDTGLEACITRTFLEKLHIKTQLFPLLKNSSSTQCTNLAEAIPHASSYFDFANLRLYLSIPQIALQNNARGYIPPDQWNYGIPAILLNYNFTGSNIHNGNGNQSNYFLNLNSGINLGSWRLRNYSTWSYYKNNASADNRGQNSNHKNTANSQWQNISTYLERIIVPFKAIFTAGDSYSPADIFDGIRFRGIQLASDDSMLPDSLRGFAPTIRGIANSNAMVTIKQNGYVIYQTYVSPGAFEINDLYPTSSSGDLIVTVKETDGKENTFKIPYSTVPILQREGRLKYAITTGKYNSNNLNQNNPKFIQGTFIWGIPHGITIYGGSQLADRYHAFATGTGLNLGDWGAFSFDITHANSVLPNNQHKSGQSFRFLYAKSLNSFGTNIQLVNYRYSTRGFYTLQETTNLQMSGYFDNSDDSAQNSPNINYYNLNYAQKNNIQINIMQTLGSFGSTFLTIGQQTYWDTKQANKLWQVGYSSSWKGVSYSLTYSYNKGIDLMGADKRFSVNISFPISNFLSGNKFNDDISRPLNTAYATYTMNTDNKGNNIQQAGLSGTLLSQNNLQYSIQQGHSNQNGGLNGNFALSYQGTYANSNAAYSYDNGYKQINYGISGGVVAYPYGITFSQPLSDTNILVEAPGADGVSIENTTGIKTDYRGYAVIPYATNYRNNRIALNTNTLKINADLEDSVVNVVPTRGALVKAKFITHIGARAFITLLQTNGNPIPFGSLVGSEDNKTEGIVDENGQVYLAGLPLQGTLKVKWGEQSQQQCKISYQLPKNSENEAISYATVRCP